MIGGQNFKKRTTKTVALSLSFNEITVTGGVSTLDRVFYALD